MAEVGDSRRGGRWRIAVWGVAGLILALPLLAMQVTDEVDWDAFDFAVMGTMLLIACGAYELAARMTGGNAYRAGAGVAIVTAFVLTWMNLAVGIIGSENNPANLMYAGVIAVAVIGGAIGRFRPAALARALVATAIAQMAVAVIALIIGEGFTVILNGFFAALWLMSAWLFRKAAREKTA